MAKKKNLRNDVTPKILRNYDPYSMEKRIYNLEQGGGVSPTPSGEVYSETETEIGTYLGDTLYRKVISSSITSLSTSNVVLANLGTLSIKRLITARSVIKSNGTTWSAGLGDGLYWITSTNDLKYKPTDSLSNIEDFKIIIEYTKNS